jgi:hypothetical protein
VREGSRAGNLQTVGWLNRSLDGTLLLQATQILDKFLEVLRADLFPSRN